MNDSMRHWDIIGHEAAISILQGQFVQEGGETAIRHAYLFTGPKGVGRRTLALRFAQALNCPQPCAPGIPCRSCRTCRMIEEMKHPDLTVIQAEQEGGTLKVDQVRDLQYQISLAPYEARYRLALLLRFEEAHPSAANALLKSLEEPPPHVVFLLTANSAETILPTILSRCQTLRLSPPSPHRTARSLQEHWKIPAQDAEALARIADGRPGYALFLHKNPDALVRRREILGRSLWLLGANRVERFGYAAALADFRAKDGEKKAAMQAYLLELLVTWLSFWRDVLILSAPGAAPASPVITNADRQADLGALASRLGLASAHQAVHSVQRALARLDANVNPRLVMEGLFLDLPHLT